MSNDKAKLEAAEARAAEAEANMLQAAEFGKDLLERNKTLEKSESELEQKVHSLKLELDSSNANGRALQDEVLDLNKRLNETNINSKIIKDLQKELDDARNGFQNKEEDYVSTINDLKSSLEKANKNVLELESKNSLPKSPNVSILNQDVIAEMQEEIEILRDQVTRLKEENGQLKNDHEEMDFTCHSLRMQLTELKQHAEEKDEELASYQESARQANEELKMKIDDENEIVADVTAKGNSLFSEVEDRRHLAEEKLKRCEVRMEKYKIMYDQKASELHKLRMQNIHLLKISNNAGGKCEQALVERLQEMLQIEKNKNRSLTEQLSTTNSSDKSSGNQNSTMEQLKTYMRQSLEDSEKLTEYSKLANNLEKQVSQLKADNATLKIRLSDLKAQTKTPSTSSLPTEKPEEVEQKVEQIFFDNVKDNTTENVADRKPLDISSLESIRNIPEDVLFSKPQKEEIKRPKKSVSFDPDAKKEEDAPPAKKDKKRIPKYHNTVVNAAEETAKWEQECKQQ